MGFGQQACAAFGLMLVLEGILPFLYPKCWRHMATSLAGVDDRQLRVGGFVSMFAGVVLLYLFNH
ncbi:MAG: DUF2065 domain-containing protein [Candidatus Endonucleobacter bathymodioli]|uniref:DUF2065 domain-containing protein n=1 Tax=Candidatus Endonucleibacter bathymodioli TaxID=539814 RepID=A0AA90NMC7_9GAMM|nr:DUF2065 domain-containing protein [Candidatus Endonucleobacter bathymodioli]